MTYWILTDNTPGFRDIVGVFSDPDTAKVAKSIRRSRTDTLDEHYEIWEAELNKLSFVDAQRWLDENVKPLLENLLEEL